MNTPVKSHTRRTAYRIKSHGPRRPYREIVDYIAARAPFVGNTMRAELNYGIPLPATTGLLDREEVRHLVTSADYAERMHLPLYVIYSYDTPIAWAVGRDGEGYVVEQKWGPTTGKHKHYARANLDRTHDERECEDAPYCRLRQTDCGCLTWECQTATSRDGEYDDGLLTCREGYGCRA